MPSGSPVAFLLSPPFSVKVATPFVKFMSPYLPVILLESVTVKVNALFGSAPSPVTVLLTVRDVYKRQIPVTPSAVPAKPPRQSLGAYPGKALYCQHTRQMAQAGSAGHGNFTAGGPQAGLFQHRRRLSCSAFLHLMFDALHDFYRILSCCVCVISSAPEFPPFFSAKGFPAIF